MTPDHAELCRLIDAEAAEVARLLATADLDAAVPSCPGWAVRDLVGHLGDVHRWATEVVRTRADSDLPPPPYDDSTLAPWFAGGALALTDALRAAEPGDACWTFAPPHSVAFWSRRQLQETMVHRWDLANALSAPAPLDPRLASDGVDEAVTMLFPRQVRLGRQAPLSDTLALVDEVDGRRWLMTGDGTGSDVPADATVTASAPDLLLLVWRRRPLDGLAVDGDEAAARRVLAARLTP